MNTTPRRLLLVDDDPSQLKLMKLTLEGHGYLVNTAPDGQSALEVLPLNPPDGIISDVLMPRLDGYQLCHAVRQNDLFSYLPIVLLSSAYTDPEDLRLAKDVGANALLARTPDVQCLARQAVESLKTADDMVNPVESWPSKAYQRRLTHQLERQSKHAQESAQQAEHSNVRLEEFGCSLRQSQKQLRLMEEQLRQSQKLETIGQIAAGVAHELNNPLGAILGFTQCLLLHPDAPDMMDVLRTMEREGLRCRTLVQNMLAFTRKPASQAAWEQLPELADGVLGLIAARAKTMRVTLEKHYEENIPPLRVNGNQIQQVFINLCSNALDAMSKGGTLSVTIGATESNVFVRIGDTGTGIPPEQLKQIFEPFFTTKEIGKGTGLGLSLVHDIVTSHQGRIEVQSEIGHGTTFNVILPRGDAS